MRQRAEIPDKAGAFQPPEVPARLVARAVILVKRDIHVLHAAVGLHKLHHFVRVFFAEWLKQHADTLVLKSLPGYANRLADMNKIINQGIMGLAGPAPKGAFSGDNRLRPRDTIAGLETEGGAKAYPMSALRRARCQTMSAA